MKIILTLAATLLFTLSVFVPANAQKQDCIICPEMLGIITSTENGVNISTLTPNQNTAIIVSSESQKAEKVNKVKPSKKGNRQRVKKDTKNKQQEIIEDIEEEDVQGFVSTDVLDSNFNESYEDCGCDDSSNKLEKIEEELELFTLYPNPAHHWVVINSANLSEGIYKLFLKDSQGVLLKEREVSSSSTKLDLRGLKQGVYFVTLRNENDFSTTVKKVTVK